MSDAVAYPHLKGKGLEAVSWSDQDRIFHIQRGAWMSLPHARIVLERMDDILAFPRDAASPRMPNLLLVGPAHSGKTTILHRFISLHPPNLDPNAEATVCPVLMIEAPPGPSRSDLFSRLLDALEVEFPPRASADAKYAQVKALFKAMGVKVLIVDEIQHMIAGSVTRQQEFRNALKSLANETKVSIIAAGVEDAYNAISVEPQWASRFPQIELPRWDAGRELGSLMATFETRTPLKKISNLKNADLVMEVAARSEGMLGDIFDLLNEAAIAAIRSGEECITKDLIRKLHWVPPSRRGRHRQK